MATHKILVVDDDSLVLESLKDYLTEAGYDVVTAEGGRAAIETARDNPCEVVLLDMKMPDVDGFQVASILRQLQPDLRVVLFTGYPSLDTESRAEQLELYEYLPKSNWYDLLLPTLERVLTAPERPLPTKRPADLEQAAAQYLDEGKIELASLALEQAARLAEFTHDWARAAELYGKAFGLMKRAHGLSEKARELRDLAESAQRMAK